MIFAGDRFFFSSLFLVLCWCFFMLMFLPCVVLLFNVYYTWLIGGGLWCDIKFLSALSFFPLLHSATTAALILSHRILSFRRFRLRLPSSRYFAHHPLWGAGRVIFFPFCHTSTQNYLYCTLKLGNPTCIFAPESRIFPTNYPMHNSRRYSHLGLGPEKRRWRSSNLRNVFTHIQITHTLRTRKNRTQPLGLRALVLYFRLTTVRVFPIGSALVVFGFWFDRGSNCLIVEICVSRNTNKRYSAANFTLLPNKLEPLLDRPFLLSRRMGLRNHT